MEYAKDSYPCFVDLEKASREKFCRVLWEYGVDGRLLLVVISLHFCSEVLCQGRPELSHSRSPFELLDSDKGVYSHHFSS